MQTLTTVPLGESVGAEVLDVDVERLTSDPEVPEALMHTLERNGVLVFRELGIDDDTQVALCRRLGEIVRFPDLPNPEIFVVTLDPKKNPLARYLKASVAWHIDDTLNPVPSKATMLSAKVLSSEGGETEFASTYAAYDALTDDEKRRLAELRVLHSQVPVQSLVHPDPTPDQLADWRSKSREHALVWTHRGGRRSLVIGKTADYVIGMDEHEGRAMLDELLDRATTPDRVYRHVWSEGDTVIWDNRGVLHRVMPYQEASQREMHRTTLAGDEPIG
jgi:alpha-ketoglutarate-dependent taurine dioxygenase